jgi:hypothetical protein
MQTHKAILNDYHSSMHEYDMCMRSVHHTIPHKTQYTHKMTIFVQNMAIFMQNMAIFMQNMAIFMQNMTIFLSFTYFVSRHQKIGRPGENACTDLLVIGPLGHCVVANSDTYTHWNYKSKRKEHCRTMRAVDWSIDLVIVENSLTSPPRKKEFLTIHGRQKPLLERLKSRQFRPANPFVDKWRQV